METANLHFHVGVFAHVGHVFLCPWTILFRMIHVISSVRLFIYWHSCTGFIFWIRFSGTIHNFYVLYLFIQLGGYFYMWSHDNSYARAWVLRVVQEIPPRKASSHFIPIIMGKKWWAHVRYAWVFLEGSWVFKLLFLHNHTGRITKKEKENHHCASHSCSLYGTHRDARTTCF